MTLLKRAEQWAVKQMSVDIGKPPQRPINSFISWKNFVIYELFISVHVSQKNFGQQGHFIGWQTWRKRIHGFSETAVLWKEMTFVTWLIVIVNKQSVKMLEIVLQKQNSTYIFNSLSKYDSQTCSMNAEKFDKWKLDEEGRVK